MKKIILIIIVIMVVVVAVAVIVRFLLLNWAGKQKTAAVTNFNECVEARYPVTESLPRQCQTPDGKIFIEDTGNLLEKQNLIRVDTPQPNDVVSSPLQIAGEARGPWFFEASFPISILDANGNELGRVAAQATSEWTTNDFVPFVATLTFSQPSTATGTLVFEKDNPSDLSENADEMHFPVRF